MTEKKYHINEYGEIIRDGVSSKTAPHQDQEDLLNAERHQLEYEIFSHPDRFSAKELEIKKTRLAVLNKILNIDPQKSADVFAAARAKIRANLTNKSGQSLVAIMAQHKQNDK